MGTIEPLEPLEKQKKICRCCNGKGWQWNSDGLKVKCPCCRGSGRANIGVDEEDKGHPFKYHWVIDGGLNE